MQIKEHKTRNLPSLIGVFRLSRTWTMDEDIMTGKITNKTSMSAEKMKMIMENADIKDRRCIYENDEILVQHMRADYPNGTKDATMHVSLKKDGLLWRSETGVTAVKT